MDSDPPAAHRPGSDLPFYAMLFILGGTYVVMLVGMLVADVVYMVSSDAADQVAIWPALEWLRPVLRPMLPILAALGKPEIQFSIQLTLVSCFFTAILSLLVAVPLGFALSRYRFPGRNLLDAVLDIPIVLPPLVVGLSLLILFQYWPFNTASRWIVYQIPGVVLAQFMVAAAFAIRTMRATFDQIDTRLEQVALTLGCNQAQAFMQVVFPQSRQGMLTAGTLAWARALGEFGPLLIFAGATRNKTEVLSTTVFLELSIGDLEAAVAVSLIMVFAAVLVLVIARVWGTHSLAR
jgi:molybdate transport system permease protein